MQINKVLKGLLSASVVAAMLSGVTAQAQQSTTAPVDETKRAGTSGSQGSTSRPGDVAGQGQAGSTATGSTSSGATAAGQSTSGSDASQKAGTSGSEGSISRPGDVSGQTGASGATGQTGAGMDKSKLSKADQTIVKKMAMDNMLEIEGGRMAQSKGTSEQVKAYGQQMIDDHTKALGEVQALAQAKGITLPTELDKAHKAKADKLGAMSGAAFDKAYMAQAGVTEHKRVHKELKAAASKAKDPDVKSLAAKMTPTVEQHLNAAQQMSKGGSMTKGTTESGSGHKAEGGSGHKAEGGAGHK